ncbi:MAG: hypothetical protein RBT45_05840 [Acholeplasmataceae bacterium]|jgi:hypothetical protein|nr:hypothetical protein [Acholeplasmataceae bacterium]
MITTYYKDPNGNIQNFQSSNQEEAEKAIKYLVDTGYVISDIEYKKSKCRECGCDDDHACKGGCYWVKPDLCSQCYERSQIYSIKLRTVKMIGDVIQDGFYDIEVLAEEIPTYAIAEGFIYGYAAAKSYEDLSDEALDDDKEFQAIAISIWQNDEVIIEFFFSSEEVES